MFKCPPSARTAAVSARTRRDSSASSISDSPPDTIGLAAQAAPSPDQQRINAMSLDLDAMRQSIERGSQVRTRSLAGWRLLSVGFSAAS